MTGCSGNSELAQSNESSTTTSQTTEDSTSTEGTTAAEDTPSDDLLVRIQEKDEIVIAMEGTWAPWTYHDEDDQLVGYDVEVGQKIADQLGVDATFVEGKWDGLLAGLVAGRYDIMVNGVEITDERAEKYDYMKAHLDANIKIAALTEQASHVAIPLRKGNR